jgi:hypothetical protein
VRDNWSERLVHPWLVPGVVALSGLLAYFPFIASPPLLDEQFLLAFVKQVGTHGVPLSALFAWRGPAPADLWGPLTPLALKIETLVLFGSLFLQRLAALSFHIVACIAFSRFVFASTSRRLLAVLAGVLAASFPLAAEAVQWLGGHGSLLAGMFVVASLVAYQAISRDWRWLLASGAFFICALLSSAAIWPLALLFPLYQVVDHYYREDGGMTPAAEQPRTAATQLAVVAPLGFMLITACYIAASGLFWPLSTTAAPDFTLKTMALAVRACFFPINESLWPHYIKNYRVLYVLYGLLFVPLFFSARSSSRTRRLLLFSLFWLVLTLVPTFGHVGVRATMFGSHLLYPAGFPVAALAAMLLLAPMDGCPHKFRTPGARRYLPALLAAAAAFTLIGFYLQHVWKQQNAYAAGARALKQIQRSVRLVHDKTGAPYVMARDLPGNIAIAPGYSTASMVVFDGKTRLLSSNHLSGGRLKDALRRGEWRDAALRWNSELRSLIRLDLAERQDAGQAASASAEDNWKLDGKQISARLMPPLEYYRTVRLDPGSGELILDSNSATSGAAIKLSAGGLEPLGQDFLYLDARIDCPPGQTGNIELYWVTPEQPEYDNKQRRVVTAAVTDNRYHRYYLPLRSVGWVTGGPATAITIGFPAGARVALKELGTAPADGVMPRFDLDNTMVNAGAHYDPPFFNFPTLAQLGLLRVQPDAATIPVRFSCREIPGASAIMVEISMANRFFPNPNGREVSGVSSSTFTVEGNSGSYQISAAAFPLPGLYSIRAIALDAAHNPIGNFSDELYCLITRPYRSSWSQ